MLQGDYKKRVAEIRGLINSLADDMGARYSTRIEYIEKIINDAVDGDLIPDGIQDSFAVDVNSPVLGDNKAIFRRLS